MVRMDAPQSGRWSLDLGIKLSATDAVIIEAPILPTKDVPPSGSLNPSFG
jgi:hypothetical protein